MSDGNNVIGLSEATGNAVFQSPEQVLRDAIKETGSDGSFMGGEKLLILGVDDNGQYSVSFMQAGMKMSECLTLCEVGKDNIP